MKKLSKSPLILVLTQVRFSPVLSIAKQIEDIQTKLRKAGLPLFEREQIQEVTLTQLGSPPEISVKQRWIFTDIAKKNSLILTDSFVALETTEYDHFPVFFDRFKTFLNIVGESLELDAVERIGLRYIDLIKPIGGKSARQLIRPELCGLNLEGMNGSGFTQFASMSQAATEQGRIMVRVIHSDEGIFVPPDLAGTKLQLGSLPKAGEAVSILDIDHYSQTTAAFETSKILQTLEALHVMTDIAFQRAVTNEAIKLWE